MRTGRPKLRPEVKRSERVIVCLSHSEKELVQAAAKEAKGIPPAVWARDVLLAAAAAALKPAKRSDDDDGTY